MTGGQAMRRIVLPQALRIVIPPIGNDTISMLKFTSLVSVLALPDLLLLGAGDLRPHLPDDPAAAGGDHLVPLLTTMLTLIEHVIETAAAARHGRPRPRRPAGAVAVAARLAGSATRKPGSSTMTAPLVFVDRVRKSFRGMPVLNGHQPRGRGRRSLLHHRPVRIGQDDAAALHQPTGEDRRRDDLRRRRSRRRDRARIQAARDAARKTWLRSAARSAWCSRASTCSRTRRCSTTSSRRR